MNVSLRLGNRRLAPDAEAGLSLGLKGVLALLAILTAAGLFYAYTAVKALSFSYELSRELDNQREQMEVGRRLRVELNNLRSPERLEREAARQGLTAPKSEQLRGLQ